MNSSTFVRWSGVFAMIAGVLWIANAVLDGVTWMYYLSQLAALITFIGIYLFQRESAGILGLIGFLMVVIGFPAQAFGLLPGIADIFSALGIVVLAIAALRARSFAWWIPVLWVASPVLGILGFALPDYQYILFPLASVLFGLGLIGAGVTLWRSPQMAEAAETAV